MVRGASVDAGDSRKEWTSVWLGFKHGYSAFAPLVNRYECKAIEMPEMNEDSPATMFMPHNKEDKMSIWPLAMLITFVNSHNSFLERAHEVLPMQVGSRQRAMWHSLDERDFLGYRSTDLEQVVKKHAQQSAEFGGGGQSCFAYEGIEEWVIDTLVRNKPLLSDSVGLFDFIGEIPTNASNSNQIGKLHLLLSVHSSSRAGVRATPSNNLTLGPCRSGAAETPGRTRGRRDPARAIEHGKGCALVPGEVLRPIAARPMAHHQSPDSLTGGCWLHGHPARARVHRVPAEHLGHA